MYLHSYKDLSDEVVSNFVILWMGKNEDQRGLKTRRDQRFSMLSVLTKTLWVASNRKLNSDSLSKKEVVCSCDWKAEAWQYQGAQLISHGPRVPPLLSPAFLSWLYSHIPDSDPWQLWGSIKGTESVYSLVALKVLRLGLVGLTWVMRAHLIQSLRPRGWILLIGQSRGHVPQLNRMDQDWKEVFS